MSPSAGDVESAIAIIGPIVEDEMRGISRAIARAPESGSEEEVRSLTLDLATIRLAWDMLCRAARSP